MIRRLLERLPQYRGMEADLAAARDEVQRLSFENEKLQDRLDAAVAARARQWDLLRDAIGQMALSYQASLNMQWQQRGFGAPYPDAPKIPPTAVPQKPEDPIVPRGEFPSERLRRATNRFAAEMAERLIDNRQ